MFVVACVQRVWAFVWNGQEWHERETSFVVWIDIFSPALQGDLKKKEILCYFAGLQYLGYICKKGEKGEWVYCWSRDVVLD